MNQSLVSKTWEHKLFDCCYKDKKGCYKFFPYFFPMSFLAPCCLAGRIQSLMDKENTICCEMGYTGMGCCLISLVPGLIGPVAEFCYFCWLSNHYRNSSLIRYNVTEEKPCFCFKNCEQVWFAICCPWLIQKLTYHIIYCINFLILYNVLYYTIYLVQCSKCIIL